MSKFIILFCLVSIQFNAAHAEDKISSEKSSFWSARYDEFTSPWTTNARPWLVYGTATTLVLVIFFEDSIVDPVQEDTTEDKPLGKFSSVGDYAGQMIPNALYALGMGINYWSTKNSLAAKRFWVMTKATLYATGVTSILKPIVHEPRPNNSAQSKSYVSFPSGHTTTAFAFSSAVIAEHGMWPWGAAATGLATLTAYSRMNDNAHYLHDVMAGFTIGTAYGLGISYLETKRYNEKKSNENQVRLFSFPMYSNEFKGIYALYEF